MWVRLLLSLSVATGLAYAAEQDYPQWRGVDRDGAAGAVGSRIPRR
jgi:hypothetical protein